MRFFFIILFSHNVQAFEPISSGNAQYDYIEEYENLYTKTKVHYPKLCKDKAFTNNCSFFMNYYSSRFEHDYISFLAENFYEDNEIDLFSKKTLGLQDVYLDLRAIREHNFLAIIARVNQSYKETKFRYTEIYNFNLKNNQLIKFKDLFEDSELAAMLCSNLIEKKFRKNNKENLETVKATVETDPKNFLLLPDGIEFEFSPGLVSDTRDYIIIKLEDLKEAKPNFEFFLKKGL